ncbi:GroES-like protein [Glarea lozoyensis ATCC 20868]|uniref:GroES-like protein n=1 Tax=Glarea lozoyensis (strain ATCC 20868 / MF5171) TaxID=1116229 RepID=S3CWP1_GLAL2|nr:GroES-like protein [Glarea lozoyensis ATCC 20868]EPE24241.1 GroES-like protein [Glarea lozoyensis ATCC 20868]
MASQGHPYISQSLLTPPKTPPPDCEIIFHNWPEPETAPEAQSYFEAPWEYDAKQILQDDNGFAVRHQEVLLLHGVKQRYAHTKEQPIPRLENDSEMLVAVEVVGLNPIDWKAPDFGWGLPKLPCISGRDFAGKVVKAPTKSSRFELGQSILGIATDYRDSRRSAFQQYAVVSDFNACKLPPNITAQEAAPLGVAFVAAVLALGVCMGVDFASGNNGPHGPDLLQIVRSIAQDSLPKDIRAECFDKLKESGRARSGDWIAIWGGSSATGCCAVQLAKLAGLRVISVIDVARSGERMLRHGADLLVDRLDTERAVSIVKSVTKGKLRFGLDTIGKDTAGLLAQAMSSHDESSNRSEDGHVVGLVGVPKESTPGVVYHSVPIKLFHEAPQVGESMMIWLEKLLAKNTLATPDIEVAVGGLEGINSALDRLRDGTVNGPRIVVPI